MGKIEFNNGKLKICQLTDIHLEADGDLEKYNKELNLICEILDNTKPDLITITGDLSWGQKTAEGIKALAKIIEERKIPWAPVLGNHDGNPGDSEIKTREEFAGLLLGYDNSHFEIGDADVDGNGNYTVEVTDKAGNVKWVLYMLDSHQGDFYPSQLEWYRKTSNEFPEKHKELAFFHVPIPEYWEVWNFEYCKGVNNERECVTHYNDGLFSTFVRGGKMRGVFVGHDHINDYEGTLHGIRLCYGRGTGYQCYGLEGFPLGARIIELDESKDDFDTWFYLEGGQTLRYNFVHKPQLTRKH